MNTLDSKTYYELLEVSMDASACDIKRAYHDALAIYDDDALVTYSLFTEKQRADILQNIETAFETLIDKDKRDNYNRRLFNSGKAVSSAAVDAKEKPADFLSDALNTSRKASLRGWVKMKSADDRISALIDETLSSDEISGNDLKTLRCEFGIETSELYEITRISGSMIKNMEEDRYDQLPADIYLKQFLRSYAQVLQIDARAVVEGYLKRKSGSVS